MSCWSDLANDMLEHLTGLLSLPDQHRFSAVCRNWRLVAKQKRCYPPKPQLPWLVLGEDKKTKKRNFFNLSEQRFYSIDIPELYGQYICGSSHGWLSTVDMSISGRVVNPFTRECIHLPPFPPYDEKHNITTYTDESVLSNGKVITYSFGSMQKMLVLKAILSHDPREKPDDLNVMILFGKSKRVAIWRPGNKNWKVIDSMLCGLFRKSSLHDIFYSEGKLYAVDSHFDYVYVIDVGSPNFGYRKIKTQDPLHFNALRYIMVFKANLFVFSRFRVHKARTTNFAVRTMGIDWCPFGFEEWRELGKLDDEHEYAVFVGNNATIFVNPAEFPTQGCLTNGIYFSDAAPCYIWEAYGQAYGHDFGMYDMDKNTLGRFCCNPYRVRMLPRDAALTWFIPSP